MKLNPNSTHKQTSDARIWEHPWNKHMISWDAEKEMDKLNKPNPPTKEAIEKAKFVDKTYEWSGSDSIRSRNKRTTK